MPDVLSDEDHQLANFMVDEEQFRIQEKEEESEDESDSNRRENFTNL